jgi:hypothetical protein
MAGNELNWSAGPLSHLPLPTRIAGCGIATLIILACPIVGIAAPDGKALYGQACAACHADDGAGRSAEELGFDIPLPDFGDCEFASREPNGDWHAVIHEGGPVRKFDRMMPAFGDALTAEDIQAILAHVRSFCTDDSWPRGEFNLPRPLFTEKAFPEDEVVVTAAFNTDRPGNFSTEFLYEKRIGPRGMVEVAVPLERIDPEGGPGEFGIGDVAVGYKHAVHHRLDKGRIFSLGGEVILPTGSETRGLGSGTTVFEPYVAFGQILPSDSFIQFQAFAEFKTDSEADDEVGARVALGRTFTSGDWGRSWTPMVEVLSVRDLHKGANVNIDLVPQVQVSLSTRQHLLLNAGVRVPVNHTQGRDTQFVVYLLWDWFDGGFFDGW